MVPFSSSTSNKYLPLQNPHPATTAASSACCHRLLVAPALCCCFMLLASNLFLLYRASLQSSASFFDVYSSSNGGIFQLNSQSAYQQNPSDEAEAGIHKNVPSNNGEENRSIKQMKKLQTVIVDQQLEDLVDLSLCKNPSFLVTSVDENKEFSNANGLNSSATFLRKWLLKSSYYTNNQETACLTVQIVDLADTEATKALEQMPNEGRNQLVIFTSSNAEEQKPFPVPPLRGQGNWKAIFVANHFAEGQFRPGADFQLDTEVPDYNEDFWKTLPMVAVKDQQKNRSQQISVACPFARHRVAMLPICEQALPREDQIGQALFTAVPGDGTLQSTSLAAALLRIIRAGSVPLLIGGPNPSGGGANNPLLPFAGFLQLNRAVIWVHSAEAESDELREKLSRIGAQSLAEKRRNGRYILEHHLGNAKVFIRSLLSAIRLRLGLVAPPEGSFYLPELLMIPAKNTSGSEAERSIELREENVTVQNQHFEDTTFLWNQNPTHLDATPMFSLRAPNAGQWQFDGDEMLKIQEREEKFTIIMLAYQRDKQLAYSLNQLDGLPLLDRVIVIWNDVERQPPRDIFPAIHVPIAVLNGTRNSLNNRFLPLAMLRTEAVFNMDDDFNTGDQFRQQMLFSFRVWQANRHAVVGPNFRIGLNDYNGSPQCKFNMVLSSGAFFHRAYLRAFSDEMAPVVRAHIEEHKNCEDIALNFLVGHLTGRPAIKTTGIRNTKGMSKVASAGLSARGDHYAVRSECVRLFTRVFGYNPMVISQYRVDTLLDGEEGVKCFQGN